MSDQETASITVLRTCDAKKAEFEMSMSASLNDLKDTINESDAFGPLPRDSQRIFHLGRELKTGGRSLSALGMGRFRVFMVHLLAKASQKSSGTSKQQPAKEEEEVVEVVQKRRARNRVQNAQAVQQQQQQEEVIELSDDDDDDEVEVVQVPPKRQRTQR